MSRALEIIGDKWSFMVVREGFFGNRRYDGILTELAIAPNILTDRLNRLVASGAFYRRQYQSSPDRLRISPHPTWDWTSMVRSSRCCDGATAGSPKGKPPLILTASQMRSRLRAVGRLRPLQEADRAPRTCVIAWRTIRNRSAHWGRGRSTERAVVRSASRHRALPPA